jgi:hypothetical protein
MGASCDAVGPSAGQPSKSEAGGPRPPNRDNKEVTLDAALDPPPGLGHADRGLAAVVSPIFWVSTSGDRDGVWALIVLGALLAVTALFSLAMPVVVAAEWFTVLFGVLLFVAPWVLTYTGRTAASWPRGSWERSRWCSAAARCRSVAGRVARRSSTSPGLLGRAGQRVGPVAFPVP